MTEGERRFFFQLLEMGRHANLAEALQEHVEGAVSELLSVSSVTRAEQDEVYDEVEGISFAKQNLERSLAEATTEAGDLCLQKFSVDASIHHLSNKAAHTWEETSRLLSKLNIVKVKWDEAVKSATAAGEEASWFSTELIAFRSEAEALRALSVDLDVNGEMSHAELEAVRGEAEVAQLRAELETSQADLERLQVASSQGGDALSLGSISTSSRASVIAEYLRIDVQRHRKEFKHSNHS
ncbi:hypothetical protein ACLOJK_024375 [Asimina triloba]